MKALYDTVSHGLQPCEAYSVIRVNRAGFAGGSAT